LLSRLDNVCILGPRSKIEPHLPYNVISLKLFGKYSQTLQTSDLCFWVRNFPLKITTGFLERERETFSRSCTNFSQKQQELINELFLQCNRLHVKKGEKISKNQHPGLSNALLRIAKLNPSVRII